MSYEQIFENVKELHNINFDKERGIIKMKNFDKESFSLMTNYDIENYCFRQETIGYCNNCKDIITHNVKKNPGYEMKFVTHGSHSFDFFQASDYKNIEKEIFDKNEVIDIPILFLMENPSNDDDGIYKYLESDELKIGKKPTTQWYWIHGKKEQIDSDSNRIQNAIKQKEYGKAVYSLICEFKLVNAYQTNIVKCGISLKKAPKKYSFLNTDSYSKECKNKCRDEILKKEIDALTNGFDKLIVFAFGSRTRWLVEPLLKTYEGKQIQLLQLVHPASYSCNDNFRQESTYAIVKEAINNESFGCIKC